MSAAVEAKTFVNYKYFYFKTIYLFCRIKFKKKKIKIFLLEKKRNETWSQFYKNVL